MATTDVRNSDGAIASRAAAAHLQATRRTSPLKYTPGFLYILALFIVGKFIFPDPRDTVVEWGQYHLSWVEVLMVAAAMMAMAEQLKVSYPGVDNTIEAILMGAVAGIQVVLFALGAAGVEPLDAIFNNTEFLMLTLISLTQSVVAILINARTLRRTIGVGDNGQSWIPLALRRHRNDGAASFAHLSAAWMGQRRALGATGYPPYDIPGWLVES